MNSSPAAKAEELKIMTIAHMPVDQFDIPINAHLVIAYETVARFRKPSGAGAQSLPNEAVTRTTLRNYLLLVGDSE